MAKPANTYHHIVPQCYLKNFAVEGKSNFVYVFDKIRNKTYTQPISKIAGINNFYTVSNINETICDSKIIEKEYLGQTVERDYSVVLSQVIDSINNNTPLSIDLRFNLAVHLAIQFLRTKEVREKDERILSDFMPQVMELFKEGLAMEKKEPLIKDLDISYQYDSAAYHFNSSFGNEDLISTFATQLHSNYWNYYYSKAPVFYTSPFPIVVNPHVQNVRPLCLGLTQYGAELSFPISPNIMLVIWDKVYFTDKASTDGNIIFANDVDIRKFNWMRYFYSDQVFSHTDDFSILELIYLLNGKHEFLKYK